MCIVLVVSGKGRDETFQRGLKMRQVQGPGWLKVLWGRKDGTAEGCELCRGPPETLREAPSDPQSGQRAGPAGPQAI